MPLAKHREAAWSGAALTRWVWCEPAPIRRHVELDSSRLHNALQLAIVSRGTAEILKAGHHFQHGECVHDIEVFSEALVRAVAESDVGVCWAVEADLVAEKISN